MECDTCKYWQPVYAPYIKRLVPCCTNKSKKTWEVGPCKRWVKKCKQ